MAKRKLHISLTSFRNHIYCLLSPEAVSSNKRIGKTDFSWWKFLLLALLSCVILFLRRPDGILHAQFYAEDGVIFFKDAFELSFWSALIKPYAGYLHFIPRIIAGFCTLFPLSIIPPIYNIFSLLVAGTTLSWFYLPNFRHIVRNDFLRLLLVLVLLVAPNQEALMSLSYIQWYVLLWATLITFMRLPKNDWVNGFILLGLVMTFWTAPIAIVLLPIWLLKLIYLRSGKEKAIAGFVLIMGIAPFILSISMWNVNNGVHITIWPTIYTSVRGFLLTILSSSLLGPHLVHKILNLQRLLIYCVVIAESLGMLTLIIWNRRRLFINILLFYIIGASVLLALIIRLPQWIQIFGLSGAEEGFITSDRYFFLGTATLYLFIFICIDSLRINSPNLKKTAVALALVAIICLNMPTFREPPLIDMDWPKYSKLIISTQQSLGANESVILKIPINPPGWFINLNVRK